MLKKIFLALSAFFAFAAIAHAGDTARVLFIGNSYTGVNDLPEVVAQIAASTGDVLIKTSQCPGGTSLQYHSTEPSTLALIDAGGWDFVVLQEQSQRPAFPDAQVQTDFYPFAKTLSNRVKQYNPCARVIFYNTWGYKNGDAMNCGFFPPLCTYKGMDSMIRLRYRIAADSNDAWIAPAGPVWRFLRTASPGIELYDMDQSHPSLAGTYAAACAFYSTIFGKNPALATFTGAVNPGDAAILRQAAKAVAFDSLTYWRQFGVPPALPVASFTFSKTGKTVSCNSTSQFATQYLWLFGDGGTAATVNATHTYATNGSYTVRLIAGSNCGGADTSSQAVLISSSGVADGQPFSKVSLYPSPATDVITLCGIAANTEAVLTEVTGRVVLIKKCLANQDARLDVSGLVPGVYFVWLQGESGRRVWSVQVL